MSEYDISDTERDGAVYVLLGPMKKALDVWASVYGLTPTEAARVLISDGLAERMR